MLGVLIAILVAGQAGSIGPGRARPNVLLIMIDDQNDWIGCLKGHPLAKTPHIDALARRGMLFNNAHCQAPLCNPSRTSLLTGLRPSTTGVHGLMPWYGDVASLRGRECLPQAFGRAGYSTLVTGKIWHAVPPADRAGQFKVWGHPGGPGVGQQDSFCRMSLAIFRLNGWQRFQMMTVCCRQSTGMIVTTRRDSLGICTGICRSLG